MVCSSGILTVLGYDQEHLNGILRYFLNSLQVTMGMVPLIRHRPLPSMPFQFITHCSVYHSGYVRLR
jgi:hypothetical protein